MSLVKVKTKGQVTLSTSLRQQAGLRIGDLLDAKVVSGKLLLVAAIFSRDGYIRFFRLDDDLEIGIYGSGVEHHGKNNFRLTAGS